MLESHSESTPDASLLFTSSQIESQSSNPPKSPRRLQTDPLAEHSAPELRPKTLKRIIIFCDGTWQDGISAQRSRYTNVLRLARTVKYEDQRFHSPIPQIVFYQSGIGTENNFYSQYVEGTSLETDKVEEAYAFIAHNYHPGDEIFLFGFSRGAYTARMVAMFIGEVGVLDRTDMDHFAGIFIDFQELGSSSDGDEKRKLEEKLAPWRSPNSRGRQRADVDRDKFTIKCLGVWDTVGAIGLPKEFTPLPLKTVKLFGFPDQLLGDHIQHAFQALALNEMRVDFTCNRFKQIDTGKLKNQILKQCWFAGDGAPSLRAGVDGGGSTVRTFGDDNHDLSDITLVWMASQIENILSLDLDYLKTHFQPVAPWGKQQPHDSATGIFLLADKTERTLPTMPNDPETHETIHPSVLEQMKLGPALSALLAQYPDLVCPLTSLEEQMKKKWPYDPNSKEAQDYAAGLKTQATTGVRPVSWVQGFKNLVRSASRKGSVKRAPKVELQHAEGVTVSRSGNSTTVAATTTTTATIVGKNPLPKISRPQAL
ncbi:hypothetical protein BDZ97DRAFT_1703631 [Flammula alnicola]|nr:hypothetical protein BDZ97DRAFT_1703631 [Flammula alnicola]